MTADIQIPSFTMTCLVVTAAVCLAAVFVAWYTVRDRVKLSQIILGVFSYFVVMLLENLLGSLTPAGLAYGLYVTVSVVAARELVRFLAMGVPLRRSFQNTDAAIGFALGFAGTYLIICAVYYFSCYTTVRTYLSSGMDTFVADGGAEAREALDLLRSIAGQNGWQFIATGVNRVFFLVRETALCVLLWYAMEDGDWRWYILVPVLHLMAMVPDGLYQAGLLESSYLRDGATCVLSAGIAFLSARRYNAREDQVAHYEIEHLRARRRK